MLLQGTGLALPPYAASLVSTVAIRTGYPIRVTEEEAIGYDSELRIAGRRGPFHEIAVCPDYRDYRLHFLVNGAVKILRFWEVPPEKRLFPASERGKGLPSDDFRELRQKLRCLSPDQLEQFGRFLYGGMVRQLTSMPLDIRVERELAETFPEHSDAQRTYLERQVRDLEPHFLPELAEVCPERLYAASTAMNVVLTEEAAEIADVEPGRDFLETPYRPLGEKLRS